ncbi:MAG: hypothetical protein EPN21_05800 [Methylococcaceae bacterium]|nr:MAG: hypothetical protein EPN21_05800 [Methylococcaceae bacterium]
MKILPFICQSNLIPGFFYQSTCDNPSYRLGLAANNLPPAEGKYIVLIAVMDIWRLIRSSTQQYGVPFFYDDLSPAVRADVKNGRAILVLDLSNEGPVISTDFFRALLLEMEACLSSKSRLLFVSQNRNLHGLMLFELPNGGTVRIEHLHYDYFIKEFAVSIDAGAGKSSITALTHHPFYDQSKKRKLALCLNGATHNHRLLTCAALIHMNLLDESLVSYHGAASPKQTGGNDINALFEQFNKLSFLKESAHELIKLSPLFIDRPLGLGNDLAFTFEVDHYDQTYFSIVTETDFFCGEVDRLTEKSFKPACLGHPFFIVGNPASIAAMESFGFDCFRDVFRHSYDLTEDPEDRFCLFLQDLAHVVAFIKNSPDDFVRKVAYGVSHNLHFARFGFLNQYRMTVENAVFERMAYHLGL